MRSESICATLCHENASCERLNRIIKNRYLRSWKVNSVKDLKVRLPQAVRNCNNNQQGALLKQIPIRCKEKLLDITQEHRLKFKIFTLDKANDDKQQLTIW